MDKKKLLADLYQDLEKTYKNFPLAKKPEDIIPGEGPETAQILFIGEAPGYQETVERRPFVGRSGKFFRKTLLEEAKIPESEVYISNIVKVRPPENRDPTPVEIQAFKPVLDQEIQIIAPKLIVTLGRFSMGKFLHDVKISQVHGLLHKVWWSVDVDSRVGGLKVAGQKTASAKETASIKKTAIPKTQRIFVLPMYHPAAGLRSNKMRESFIEDFKKIPKIIKWIEEQDQVSSLKDSVVEHLF